jgi:deoxyhypusine synthase
MTNPAEESGIEHDPVAGVRPTGSMSVGDLVAQYADGGIGASALSDAVDVATTMVEREDTTVFLGLAGAMVPAGMRPLVADLLRDGHVDALVTTGANLTHDAIEAIGGHHHHGSAEPDSDEGEATLRDHDEALREKGVDRIYDVYLPQEHFTAFETHLRDRVFPDLTGDAASADGAGQGSVSIRELTEQLGVANAAVAAGDPGREPGIAAAAAEHDVPIYCPAIQDSVLGLQAWLYSRVNDFALDALADMTHLSDVAARTERSGALVVGGGVPKNYVLQTMLVNPGAYDYAVQLTMDPPETGGLSGATLDEARSWGKLEPDAENASVYADATITFPLLVAALRERLAG